MKGKMKGFGLYLIILVCLLAGVSYVVSQTQQTETLSYNQIYNYFMDGDVDQYDVDDTTLTMHLKKENQTYTYDLGDYRSVFYNDLGETIQQQMRDGTLTKVDYRTATIPWWAQFLPYVILIVLLIAFWCFMMNKQSGGGAGPMQFGKARAKLAQDDKRKVTFNDVAGADEEKAELQEIVEFLKNPQKFVQIGARIPKGVLLVVSGMAEAAVILVQTFRKAKDDEEHPPRLAFLIAKLTFCAALIGLAVGMTVLTQNW